MAGAARYGSLVQIVAMNMWQRIDPQVVTVHEIGCPPILRRRHRVAVCMRVLHRSRASPQIAAGRGDP